MKLALKSAAGLVALYALLLATLLTAMHQPPDDFGQFMAKVPGPAFRLLPFRPLWMFAREGRLKPGDPAPDFTLQTVDRSTRVQLSAFRGTKPVVLVFGSYT